MVQLSAADGRRESSGAGGPSGSGKAPTIDFIANPGHRDAITESGTEIRVHGVGDHANFSALGRPGYENRRKSQVVICEPPQLPSHHLLLIAWSRANRHLTRTLWWYLLFPFTLINLAGYMAPRRRRQSLILQACISMVSVILTVSLAAWLIVIVETVWLPFVGPVEDVDARLVVCMSGPLAVAAVIVKRLRRNDVTSGCGAVCSSVHLVALAALAVVCYWRPAQWTSWFSDPFDPMTCLLIGSSGLVLAIALALSGVAVHAQVTASDMWAKRDASALAGAALLLLLATAVLHTAASLIRLVIEWMARLLNDIRDGVTNSDHPVSAVAQAGAQRVERGRRELPHLLLPHLDGLSRIDLLLGFFGVLVVILGVGVLGATAVNLWLRAPGSGSAAPRDPDRRSMSKWHSILRHAPACLSFVMLATATLTLAAWVGLAMLLRHTDNAAILACRNIILVVGIAVIGFLIIRRPERAAESLKVIFEMVADIAGFWQPRSVPLAGASYRLILMDGIDEAIRHAGVHPVALVGHSQGSVICAWYMATRRAPQSRITLYTCGCPLWSLYAAFFPAYFGRDFFANVARNSAGRRWFNYWRLTDPIATALPFAHDDDVTELRSAPLFGHGEYWREPQLRADIDAALHGADDLAAQA
ncbi:hypothetical protein [Mycolicibacterium chubuense]|nr:hypothetical protein [Mycolicibacterium chubuense]